MLKHVVALIAAVVLSSQFVSAESVVVPAEIPTLREAIWAAGWDDTIWIAPGVYSGDGFSEIVWENFSVEIIGQGGAENTIIDAGGSFFFKIGGHLPNMGNGLILEGITVRNGTTLVETSWGDWDWVHLHHSIFTDNRVVVRGGSEPGWLCVWDCQFLRNDTAIAVFGYAGDWGNLSSSHFANNGVGLLMEHADNGDISCCIFTGNDSAIVSIDCNLYLSSCVLYRNQYGLVVNPDYYTSGSCNDVYGSTMANFVGTPDFSGTNRNISADPMFCDPTLETGFTVADVSPLLCSDPENCGAIGDVTAGCDCCLGGTVGDLDFDIDHQVTMGDLTMLIDNLFISYTPLFCPNEANLDGDPAITMGDLTVLIDHLFISYDPLPPCP